jgi:mannose-6-phosphate isomerase-like protein (cupin superfamily)
MFVSERIEIVLLTLHPAENIPLHANPVNVVFFIISGTGLIEMEHVTFEGKPN